MNSPGYMSLDIDVRRLRYRLKRQGMLELDAWLSRLDTAILLEDKDVVMAVNKLLTCEPPELQAMMHGDEPLPKILQPWLK